MSNSEFLNETEGLFVETQKSPVPMAGLETELWKIRNFLFHFIREHLI